MVKPLASVLVILAVLLSLSPAASAWAGPPADQLREGFDRVLGILGDPSLAGDMNATPRRLALVKAAHEIFDFGEMARRSLGPHWSQRTSTERGEFVGLFSELVQRAYLSRVEQQGVGSMVVRSETVDGTRAIVRTTLRLATGGELPLGYRMHGGNDRWQVYDVEIDGISVVANYRAQFNKVIQSASYEALVARMKSRQAEVSASAAIPAGRKVSR